MCNLSIGAFYEQLESCLFESIHIRGLIRAPISNHLD